MSARRPDDVGKTMDARPDAIETTNPVIDLDLIAWDDETILGATCRTSRLMT